MDRSFFGALFRGTNPQPKARRELSSRRNPSFETLEERSTPAVVAIFAPQVGLLTVLGDSLDNTIAVSALNAADDRLQRLESSPVSSITSVTAPLATELSKTRALVRRLALVVGLGLLFAVGAIGLLESLRGGKQRDSRMLPSTLATSPSSDW